MSEKEKTLEVVTVADNTEEDVAEVDMVIKFSKPYRFEQVEYTEIDLSGLDDLQAADMIAVNRLMARTSAGIDVMPEVSLEYACHIAAKATKKPVEFFLQMPPKEIMKVKNRVMAFLFGSE